MAEKDFLDPDAQVNLGGNEGGGENLVLDLENIDESGPTYEALPPGIYNCIIDNTEYGLSSKSNPMITWVFKVVDPEYEGRNLYNHTVLNNEAGLARLKRTLLRVVPDVNLKEFNAQKFCDEAVAIGFPCRVKVRIRPYQGQRRNDVTDVLPAAEEGSFLDDE